MAEFKFRWGQVAQIKTSCFPHGIQHLEVGRRFQESDAIIHQENVAEEQTEIGGMVSVSRDRKS